ncbi:FAD-dependent monooxygenase [Zhengella mangrovi]|uniref:FAD-dependent monooxygenase n=1 Tax=Zhengella mangrovi TaxID=1982044 RepID=UPI00197B6365|nr:FAD-dependent monooxygenase [Zhengella mangrovi]
MAHLDRVEIVGGGPAGLYTSILVRQHWPEAQVIVHEQNGPDDTFGFGVVFSDQALDFLKADDPETHELITPRMERWRNMTLNIKGERVILDGIGFAAIGRLDLLKILKARALALGVDVRFNTPLPSLDGIKADVIVGADGLNSLMRRSDEAAFGVTVEHFTNHFAWFGVRKPFDTLTQTFVQTDRGTLNAHHYRYTPDMSTFIVECDDATFGAYGFDSMDETATARVCEDIFAETLEGQPLIANRSIWRQFPRLWCDRWTAGNRALMGDAVHTAHFSIGSGTRIAMEDAIALVRALREAPSVAAALETYQAVRPPIARKIVDAANTSATWYESFPEKMKLDPLDFAFDYIQRSGRVDLERLRRLSPEFVARYEAARGGAA